MADLRDVIRRREEAKKLRRFLRSFEVKHEHRINDVLEHNWNAMCDRAVGWHLEPGYPRLDSKDHALMLAAFATHLILNGEDLSDLERTP